MRLLSFNLIYSLTRWKEQRRLHACLISLAAKTVYSYPVTFSTADEAVIHFIIFT